MPSPKRWLLAVSFVSGAAALIYQAVWLRWFQLLFGGTAYAASATLAAFFAGLALGSAIFGRRASRTPRPLATYAAIEAGAALVALAVPLVFRIYDPLYASLYDTLAGRREVFVAAKFALAFAVMLPPALLLGGTLPLLAVAYVGDPRELGRAGGRLYAINTLGAAAGSAAGVLWLPDWIGVPATYAVAIALSLAAGAGALAFERAVAKAPPRATAPEATSRGASAPRALLAIAFASGFGTLALEVLLIQALAQVFDHSVYSYGAVLVVVLLALAAGAAIASASEGRVAADRMLGGALALEAILLFALPAATWALRDLGTTGPGRLGAGLLAAVVLGGPPLLVGALVLPLTFRLAARHGGSAIGPRIGGLLAANTFGGILGSLAASFVLLDGLGLWRSIAAVGGAYGIAALLAGGDTRERLARGALLAAAAALVFASAAAPQRLPLVALEPGDRLVDTAGGASGVVSVIDGAFGRRMKLNNHYTLEGAGRLLAAKQRAGHVPLLLHPAPRRVAFVGSSTGSTAGAAVLHPVERIDLIEIVPEVHALAARWFAETNHRVHADPRARVVVEDGRNHLRATRERYDVVVADLFSPWNPGIGALYAREHFEAVREHLAPGGLFAQWLPAYQHGAATFETIAATFLDVFPNAVVFRADLYARTTPRVALIGFRDALPSIEQVDARLRELADVEEDPWITRGFWMLYVGPLGVRAADLAAVPRNSDARPRFDFLGARLSNADRQDFLRRWWPAFSESLAERAGADAPFAAKLGAARDGAAMVRAAALRLDRRDLEMQAEIAMLRSRVPPELLNRVDPSVSELWMSR